MGLDESDDHVRASLVAAPALVEHGPGLADAGYSSEVDTELPRWLNTLIGLLGRVAEFAVLLTVRSPLPHPHFHLGPWLTRLALARSGEPEVPPGRADASAARRLLHLGEGLVQL